MKKILVAKPENVCETKNSSRLEEIILKILITGILADFQETPKITTNEKFPTLSFKLWKHLFSQQSPLKTLVSSHVFSGRKRHMEGKEEDVCLWRRDALFFKTSKGSECTPGIQRWSQDRRLTYIRSPLGPLIHCYSPYLPSLSPISRLMHNLLPAFNNASQGVVAFSNAGDRSSAIIFHQCFHVLRFLSGLSRGWMELAISWSPRKDVSKESRTRRRVVNRCRPRKGERKRISSFRRENTAQWWNSVHREENVCWVNLGRLVPTKNH